MTSELGTGLTLLLPPATDPQAIMPFGPHDACVASVPCGERRRPPVQARGVVDVAGTVQILRAALSPPQVAWRTIVDPSGDREGCDCSPVVGMTMVRRGVPGEAE